MQIDLVQGDIERLGMFRDGRFDIIITCFGMEFLPDPGACLRECFRVLRGGGMLVMGTVHPLAAFEWDADDEMLRVTDYFNPPVEVWEEPTQDETQKGLTFFPQLPGDVRDAGGSGVTGGAGHRACALRRG